MQKASCFCKVLTIERLKTLNTMREQEMMVKNIFLIFVMTYIYAQDKPVHEVLAIRAFYAKYGLDENDWEEDSAIKCWRRHKKSVLAQSKKLDAKIIQRKKKKKGVFFNQMLSLFPIQSSLLSFPTA